MCAITGSGINNHNRPWIRRLQDMENKFYGNFMSEMTISSKYFDGITLGMFSVACLCNLFYYVTFNSALKINGLPT